MNSVNIIRVDGFLTDIEMGVFDKELLKLNVSLKESTYKTTMKYCRVNLDDYYDDDRSKSDIIKIIHTKLFNEKMYSNIPETEELLKMIPLSSNSECQYTVYKPGGLYSWHIDSMLTEIYYTRPFRMANYIYYLNDDFEGGELNISFNKNKYVNTETLTGDLVITPKKNTLVIMPADAWHMVSPIIKGERRTINGHIGFR
jgi:Rps23 Pro-64 3,4-dihydroxylase Tpa1-like proline 4-hydroxylase|tara:strand:+ start:225 stop:824 length:600 start_codon:yes stop_codon:yes gene_type:complete